MRIYLTSFFSIFLFILLTAFSVPLETKTGHIFKVDVEADETLSRRQIDHYSRNGKPVYKGETDFETFSETQVENMLHNLDSIVSLNTDNTTITHEAAKNSLSNTFGNFGSNALGKSKMPFFPKIKLKKVKVKADVYYDIEVDLKYGGGKGRTVVMDKISKVSTIKFNIEVSITAYGSTNKKNILWKKEQVIKDFSEAFTDPSSPFEVGSKWFEVSRAPLLANGQKETVGDKPAKDISTDEYWQLSLDEMQICIEIAIAKTLK
jgi:hypothetical protein